MKKFFLFGALAVISLCMSAQQIFVGQTNVRVNMHYEDNLDVLVDRVKTTLENNPSLDAAQKGMAKMLAKPIVKNTLKQQETQKYITSLPEGEWTQIQKWDGVKNRIVNFVPELGRIAITDGETGLFIVAYPKLKLALKVVDPSWKTEQWRMSCSLPPATENDEIEEINGFQSIANYALAPYDETNDDPDVEIIEVIGKKWTKVPASGYRLAEYGVTVQLATSNEFFTQETNLVAYRLETEISDVNFEIPADYKIVSTADELVKPLKKAIKANALAIPLDSQFLPENIWDIK